MRVAHIPVLRKAPVVLPEEHIASLPNKVALFTTAQYLNQLKSIQEQLEKAGKQVELYQPRHTNAPGQILGCSVQTWPDVDAFLYIGEGEFHPRAILFKNAQPVYRWDPLLERWDILEKENIEKIMKQHKGAMLAFHYAKICGVMTTTKSGQKDMQAIKKLREQYPKKVFVQFLCNTLDWQTLEDFPFVDVWINTGCPRIGLDDYNKVPKAIINAEHVLEGTHSF